LDRLLSIYFLQISKLSRKHLLATSLRLLFLPAAWLLHQLQDKTTVELEQVPVLFVIHGP
jgi:hypothetical protein